MSDVKRPDGHQAVIPYLILKDAEGFSKFMQAVFGAKELQRFMRDDGTVMHGELNVSGAIIMFAEGGEQWGFQAAGMFIYVDDADKRFAKALQEGAVKVLDLSDQEYGRSGGVKDPHGNTWWITSVK